MISEQLKNFIKKQKSRIVVYPNDLFEQRVQEEMIRADEYKSFFVYVELDFAAIRKNLFKDQEEKFWDAFFKSLASKGRGSDVLGLLEKNSGFGLIMLDSKMEGWTRLLGRIREFGKNSVNEMNKPLSTIKAFVYPAYIEQEAGAFPLEKSAK